MGRMRAPGKGISSSALPHRRGPPTWLKTTPAMTSSSTSSSSTAPNKILRVLKSNGAPPPPFLPIASGIGLAPSISEDLWFPVRKAVAVRRHLVVNRKDKDSKFCLILIESRIHRLVRYYTTKQQIPPTFKYDSATASTLIA
ncbi:hypothetical protein FIBSPDRAFT_1050810 [Athelia psychrophila]|uniref:Small ribosomal subunit protein uS15 N-terminal domain-containing protein n=1 Tax=Athelia psychrophila TaxID=1759441 RepID=A0A166A8V6_9AGAM|nr:hypothetical protein FIBSPDRAFT_1050810 [Fibularhizoctonia sp. CBS 109695]